MAFEVINNGEAGLVVRGKLNDNFTNAVETTDSRLGSVGYDDLVVATTLTRAELVAVSQGGTGKKTTVRDILDSVPYGGIFALYNDVAEAAVTGTPARVVQAWTTNDPSKDIVPSFAAGTLTVSPGADGLYLVTCNIGTFVGSNDKTYTFFLYKNNGPFGFRAATLKTNASGEGPGSASISGPIALAAGDTVSLYVRSSDGGTALTVSLGDIFMRRIGA